MIFIMNDRWQIASKGHKCSLEIHWDSSNNDGQNKKRLLMNPTLLNKKNSPSSFEDCGWIKVDVHLIPGDEGGWAQLTERERHFKNGQTTLMNMWRVLIHKNIFHSFIAMATDEQNNFMISHTCLLVHFCKMWSILCCHHCTLGTNNGTFQHPLQKNK